MRISPISVVRNNQNNSGTNKTSSFMSVSKVNSSPSFGMKIQFERSVGIMYADDDGLFEIAKTIYGHSSDVIRKACVERFKSHYDTIILSKNQKAEFEGIYKRLSTAVNKIEKYKKGLNKRELESLEAHKCDGIIKTEGVLDIDVGPYVGPV